MKKDSVEDPCTAKRLGGLCVRNNTRYNTAIVNNDKYEGFDALHKNQWLGYGRGCGRWGGGG